MKTAVQFGAGNIGRGFIGNLLSGAGYRVVFVDVDRDLVAQLRDRGEYVVEIVSETTVERTVGPVSAMTPDDPGLPGLIAEAEIVTTAVGPTVLERIAPVIAAGISERASKNPDAPLSVIACENMVGGSTMLRKQVERSISDERRSYLERRVGFPDSAVDRIVPPFDGGGDRLRVRVEEYCEWIVDGNGFVNEPPAIAGMEVTDNLAAYLERKLFTLNTGHAVAAYLGVNTGYGTIAESVMDSEILSTVRGAMEESGEVLIRRYDFDRTAHAAYIETILKRFGNPYLEDETERVAREPLRKLRRSDRLIKPLLGTLEYDTPNNHLVAGIAAALAYRNRHDTDTMRIASKLRSDDRIGAIAGITGLAVDGRERELLERIAEAYEVVALQPEIERYMRRRTRIVSISEAEQEIRKLIDEALDGKEVIVARDGRPVVRLAPIGSLS